MQVRELHPLELVSRWPDRSSQLVVLDVREPDEIAVARLEEAKWIPLREIPQRLGEIPRDRPVVVMCHRGGRSRQVAAYLLANGYAEVFNLAGGIDAWAQDVDRSLPRY